MGEKVKKPKNLYSSDQYQLYGLKWEFMRRNLQYIEDYYKYFERDGSMKRGVDQKEAMKYFAKTYQLFNPLRPDLSFFVLLKELYLPNKVSKRQKHWHRLLRLEKTNKEGTKEYLLEKSLFEDSIKDMLTLEGVYAQIKFWVAGVYRLDVADEKLNGILNSNDIEDILKHGAVPGDQKEKGFFIKVLIDGNAPFDNIVEAINDELWREKFFTYHAQFIRTRQRADKLKLYLNVYTLKKETKWTFDRIAKKLYPKEHDQCLGLNPKIDIESLIKRVNEHYLQAKYYIDGGFREIR